MAEESLSTYYYQILAMKLRLIVLFFTTFAVLVVGPGCSTSFKYEPTKGNKYPPIANRTGLAIRTGQDLRPQAERRPDWARNAEAIVAQALAAEAKNAKLFRTVKIHVDAGKNDRYSEIIQFRVEKFEGYSKSGFLEDAGRDFLRSKGFRGSLISESIPIKYLSEVKIEFEVVDPVTDRVVFVKSYAAIREDNFNGYQGEKPRIQQTSAALEAVIGEFMRDLAKLPLSQQAH